jgi:tRNA isopentenyl-2-thiomethyl-A-37 hydroxylase MiaE
MSDTPGTLDAGRLDWEARYWLRYQELRQATAALEQAQARIAELEAKCGDLEAEVIGASEREWKREAGLS